MTTNKEETLYQPQEIQLFRSVANFSTSRTSDASQCKAGFNASAKTEDTDTAMGLL